jgi:hypothetical protein
MYDIKELDKQVLKLQKLAYEVETRIKEQNNTALIFLSEDLEDELFKSLT